MDARVIKFNGCSFSEIEDYTEAEIGEAGI
jgi:hypothetical protein